VNEKKHDLGWRIAWGDFGLAMVTPQTDELAEGLDARGVMRVSFATDIEASKMIADIERYIGWLATQVRRP